VNRGVNAPRHSRQCDGWSVGRGICVILLFNTRLTTVVLVMLKLSPEVSPSASFTESPKQIATYFDTHKVALMLHPISNSKINCKQPFKR
jgi:hypothetical protein